MTKSNITISGKGWRKWFWYVFCQIICYFGPLSIEGCTIMDFNYTLEETKKWKMARFIYEGNYKIKNKNNG